MAEATEQFGVLHDRTGEGGPLPVEPGTADVQGPIGPGGTGGPLTRVGFIRTHQYQASGQRRETSTPIVEGLPTGLHGGDDVSVMGVAPEPVVLEVGVEGLHVRKGPGGPEQGSLVGGAIHGNVLADPRARWTRPPKALGSSFILGVFQPEWQAVPHVGKGRHRVEQLPLEIGLTPIAH